MQATLTLTTVPQQGDFIWQQSSDGITFTDIDGADSVAYVTAPLFSTKHYRLAYTDNGCTVYSNSIQIAINENYISTYTIGTGSNSTNNFPFNGYYNYSWASSIYLADEVDNTPGVLSSVSFYVVNNPINYTMKDQKIYARHTSSASYINGSYPNTSEFELVYEGDLTFNGSGWHEIILDTPFAYDGVDNIEFLYENHDGHWMTGFPQFQYSVESATRTKRDFRDGQFPSSCFNCNNVLGRSTIKMNFVPCSTDLITLNSPYSVLVPGESITLNLDTTSIDFNQYQLTWQFSHDEGVTYQDIDESNYTEYTTLPIFETTDFRVKLSTDFCFFYSDEVTLTLNQDTVATSEIGNGTNLTGRYPFYHYYDYSYSQHIYHADEINSSGELTRIAVNVGYLPAARTYQNQRIYVRHTSESGYANGQPNYPSDTSGFTLVYEGDITYSNTGWKEFEFTTAFNYNGSDNLEFRFENHDGTWTNSYPEFLFTAGYAEQRVKRDYRDGQFPYNCTNCAAFNNIMNIKMFFNPCSYDLNVVNLCSADEMEVSAASVDANEFVYNWYCGEKLGEQCWNYGNWKLVSTDTALVNFNPVNYFDNADDFLLFRRSWLPEDENATVAFDNYTNVLLSPSPVANAGQDTTLFEGETVELGSAPVVGYTYSWSPATGLDDPTSANPIANPDSSTVYVVEVSLNECVARDTVSISRDFKAGYTGVVCADGSLRTFGIDNALGNGNFGYSNNRVPVPQTIQPPPNTSYVDIAMSNNFGIALLDDGRVTTWGSNQSGQLGNPSIAPNSSTPAIVPNLDCVVQIGSATSSSIVLKADGTVWTFGVILPNNGNSPTPVQVSNLTDIIAISVGNRYALALKEDGTVWAWGNNGDGQLGNGTNNHSATPIQISGLENITMIKAGARHAIAVSEVGNVYAWGRNLEGQLGINSTIPSSTIPVQVSGVTDVISVAAGASFTTLLTANGDLYAMGDNTFGELGDNCNVTSSFVPILVDNIPEAIEINTFGTILSKHTWLYTENVGGSGFFDFYVWGNDGMGQLGINTNTLNHLECSPIELNQVYVNDPEWTGAHPFCDAVPGKRSNIDLEVFIEPVEPLCENDAPVTLVPSTEGGEWSGVGVVGNTFDPAIAGEGTFTVTYTIGTPNCMATDEIEITVYPVPQMLIIASANEPVCNGTEVTLSAYLPYSDGSYVWTPGNSTQNPLVVTPSETTQYTVTGSTVDGCTNMAQRTVEIVDCTCEDEEQTLITQTTWDNAFPSTINSLDNHHAIVDPITVTGNDVVLTDISINIQPTVTITIQNGAKLTLNHCHLHACEELWEGIVVEDGGELVIENNSLIEDARTAVLIADNTSTTSVLTVHKSIFNKNLYGVHITNYDEQLPIYPFEITNTIFTSRQLPFTISSWPEVNELFTTNNSGSLNEHIAVGDYPLALLLPPFDFIPSSVGIKLDDVGAPSSLNEFQLNGDDGTSTFNVFDELLIGVQMTNSNASFENNVFQFKGFQWVPNFNLGGKGIEAINTADPFDDYRIAVQGDNRFFDCFTGIEIKNYASISILETTMQSTQTSFNLPPPPEGELGIFVETPYINAMDIKNNTITNIRNGIVFLADVDPGIPNGHLIGPVSIRENTIQTTLDGNSGVPSQGQGVWNGIVANNTVFPAGSYHPNSGSIIVADNKLYQVFNGIHMQNWYYFILQPALGIKNRVHNFNNYISLHKWSTLTNPETSQYGIMHITNVGGLIYNNTIDGFDNENPEWYGVVSHDIRLNNVTPSVHCNTTRNTGTGFYYNYHMPRVFQNNTMDNNQFGFVLDDAAIGEQGDEDYASGNRWINFTGGNFETFTENGSDPNNSVLWIDNSDAEQVPTLNENDQNDPLLTYTTSNGLSNVSTNANTSTCDAPTEILITAQFQQKSGGTLTEQLEQLISDSTRYGLFPQEQFIQAQHKAYRMMEKDEEWQATASTELQTFYTTAQKGNIGALAGVGNKIGKGSFSEAYNLLNTISAENAIEENYITYYTTYIHVKTGNFTVSDSLALDELIHGCTPRDGEVVNQARVLHRLVYRDFTTYYDYCPSETQVMVLSTEETQVKPPLSLIVYPNPSTGEVWFKIENTPENLAKIEIYNLAGVLIHDEVPQKNKINFNFSSGTYIIYVTVGNESYRERIVVVN